MTISCLYYKEYFSVRFNSLFEKLTCEITVIFRVIAKFIAKQSMHSVCNAVSAIKNTTLKIIQKAIYLIPDVSLSHNKLSEPGKIVQIDQRF